MRAPSELDNVEPLFYHCEDIVDGPDFPRVTILKEAPRETKLEPVPDPMRRKQGDFFVFLGAVHCALMLFASCYAMGWMPRLVVTPHRWNTLYVSYVVYLYAGSAVMIVMQSFKTEVYLPQAILDFLVGAVPFQAFFWLARKVLVRWPEVPWLSLIPGILLLCYGLRLRRGRGLLRCLDLD